VIKQIPFGNDKKGMTKRKCEQGNGKKEMGKRE
jgi:hypothetical protein